MYARSKQGRVDVIAGDQPLCAEQREELLELFDECLERGQPRVIVDLKRVPLIDSAGLELLLELRDRCRERGGAVSLAGLNPLCRDILAVTGVEAEFEIWSDVVEAAGRFAL